MEKWTDMHIRILKRDYPAKGSNIPLLRKRFSNVGIRKKAKSLDIKVNKTWKQNHLRKILDKYRGIRWGSKETAILKREYSKKGAQIKQLLSKFTKGAIKRKASILKIRRKGFKWTSEEIKKLRRNWKINTKIRGLFPHRSLFAIYNKVKRLGLKRAKEKAAGVVKKKRKNK